MGKPKGAKTPVDFYYLGLHVGFCLGPATLLGWSYGEKEAWSGSATGYLLNEFIDKQDLHGGPLKEGGLLGFWSFMDGTQAALAGDFADRLGGTPDTLPAYKGINSLYFIQGAADMRGFQWGANVPYLKDLWARFRRKPAGLDQSKALVPTLGSTVGVLQSTVADTAIPANSSGISGAEASGYTLTLDEYEYAVITKPPGLTYQAWSLTPSDGFDFSIYHGLVWTNTFKVSDGATLTTHWGGSGISGMDWYSNAADAEAATTGLTATISGPGTFEIFPWDSTVDDNRGGLSLQVDIYRTAADDANPANIIYECLTNRTWGMGAPESLLDMDSFSAAQSTLFDERFGLSMMWTRQATIESFVSEVLDHIQATLFVHPRTGKLTLKLIRNDYDPDDLPLLTPSNALLSNLQRKSMGEIISEIQVTYTNPFNEQDETVTAQDLGIISIQGGQPVTDSRNYYGVRNPVLAMTLAQRDLRASAFPLAACEAIVDRTEYALFPGSVVKITWPEYGIEQLTMRVGGVDYGKPGDSQIKVSLLEDVWSYATAEFDVPDETRWTAIDSVPTPIDVSAVITAPYYLAASVPGVDGSEYPEVVAAILSAEAAPDAGTYELYAEEPAIDGTLSWVSQGSRAILGLAALDTALVSEAVSTGVSLTDFVGPRLPAAAGLMLIGDAEAPESMEICVITAAGGTYSLRRGALDTVPVEWPVGTPVWFFAADTNLFDTEIRSDGETVEYRLGTRTAGGTLPAGGAPTLSGTMTDRPWRPNRPANVEVDGVGFLAPGGEIDASDNGLDHVVVTWSNRNRLLEDSVVLAWDAASITPEAGQTTTIEVRDAVSGTVLTTASGLTGSTYDLPKAAFSGSDIGIVRVYSERDGFESLQAHQLAVRVAGWTADSTVVLADTAVYTADAN